MKFQNFWNPFRQETQAWEDTRQPCKQPFGFPRAVLVGTTWNKHVCYDTDILSQPNLAYEYGNHGNEIIKKINGIQI